MVRLQAAELHAAVRDERRGARALLALLQALRDRHERHRKSRVRAQRLAHPQTMVTRIHPRSGTSWCTCIPGTQCAVTGPTLLQPIDYLTAV